MGRHVAVLMFGALGCGRLHFDTSASSGGDGGAGSDGAMTDAFVPCNGFGPWQPPQPLTELETPDDDWGGQITPNGLTLYYQSVGTADKVFIAHRQDRASPFVPVEQVELTLASISDPSPTEDELELFVGHNAGSGSCVHQSGRSSHDTTWSTPVAVSQFCGSTKFTCPYVSPDGLTLYVSNTTTATIAVSTRATRLDAFNAPTDFVGLSTGIQCPALSQSGLDLFVEGGSPANISETTRASTSVGFTGGTAGIAAVNTTSDEADVSITADGTELFFASDRAGGAGGQDLYHTVRACL